MRTQADYEDLIRPTVASNEFLNPDYIVQQVKSLGKVITCARDEDVKEALRGTQLALLRAERAICRGKNPRPECPSCHAEGERTYPEFFWRMNHLGDCPFRRAWEDTGLSRSTWVDLG
jgi:hypothetical protein